MSDEIHMESAWRHRDMTAIEQWHGQQPDIDLMMKEENDQRSWEDWMGGKLADYCERSGLRSAHSYSPDEALMEAEGMQNGPPDRVVIMEVLFIYLFGSGNLSVWENVAARAHAMMKLWAPHLLVGRNQKEMEWIMKAVDFRSIEPLGTNTKLWRLWTDGDGVMKKLLGFIFPGVGSRWLFRGTQRAYILARAWQPWLVTVEGRELSYEDLAEVFEGQELTTTKARNRARSRWSARVQEVLRKPIEAAGGTVRLQFSKSAGARGRMAESAKGNGNRRNVKVHTPLPASAGDEKGVKP